MLAFVHQLGSTSNCLPLNQSLKSPRNEPVGLGRQGGTMRTHKSSWLTAFWHHFQLHVRLHIMLSKRLPPGKKSRSATRGTRRYRDGRCSYMPGSWAVGEKPFLKITDDRVQHTPYLTRKRLADDWQFNESPLAFAGLAHHNQPAAPGGCLHPRSVPSDPMQSRIPRSSTLRI